MSSIKNHIILGLFIVLVHAHSTHAQTTRPQNSAIGLCLSGGGARGLAHIALLKAIDSLGIKIDYISGTSMGGIMGGLYAIGYSGKQLDSMARNTDWARLFEVKTPYDEIHPDEQDEYGRYVLELPWREDKLELPSGLIEGEALLNKLEALTAHVAHIQNFSQFPIPFRCTAANISDGQLLVLDRGSLAMALRTTMSIPGFFAPILMGNSKILVDGGVFKTFPVDVLCDMGADIVIGGYTSISLIPEHELHSMAKIMVQSTSFSRIAESDMQKLSCSIYADFAQELNALKLSASDFKFVKEILMAGDLAVQKIMPQLVALARQQKELAKEIPIKGVSSLKKPADTDLVPLPSMDIYSSNNAPIAFKAGLHYDNEMDAGLIGNLTLRNVFGAKSRTILSTEIAKNYKVRAEHRVAIRNSKFDFVTRAYFERVTAPVYFYSLKSETFKRRYFKFQTGIQRNLNKNTFTGTYLSYEQIGYKPDIRVSRRAQPFPDSDTITGVVKSVAQIPGIDFILLHQTLDQPMLPTSGGRFSIQARFSAATRVRYVNETVNDGNIINLDDSRHIVKPYTKVLIRWEHIYPISPRVALYPHIFTGFRLTNIEQEQQLDVLDRFNTGGADWRNDWSFVPFAGNREGFSLHAAFASVQMAVPFNIKKKYFVIPQYAIMSGTGLNSGQTTPLLELNNELAQSIGVTLGLQTILGPIWLNIAKADNDPAVRLYGSIGLRF
ncbi:MAG: hypothetical protein RIR11_808 [Bacteroidota bacterium]